MTGVTTVAGGRHSKPATKHPLPVRAQLGKPFSTRQPVPPPCFLLACNHHQLFIGSTHQTKYCLKHWLTFSGTIGFVQIILAQKRPALKFPFLTRRSEQSSSHKHPAILLDFFNSAICTLSNAQKKHLAWHLVGLCPNYLLPPP